MKENSDVAAVESTALAAAAIDPTPEPRSSTSTGGDGTFLDVQLSGPPQPTAAEPAAADAAAEDAAFAAVAAADAAAASAVGLGSQGDLVLMEQQASKVGDSAPAVCLATKQKSPTLVHAVAVRHPLQASKVGEAGMLVSCREAARMYDRCMTTAAKET
jgi:hypothetical protein